MGYLAATEGALDRIVRGVSLAPLELGTGEAISVVISSGTPLGHSSRITALTRSSFAARLRLRLGVFSCLGGGEAAGFGKMRTHRLFAEIMTRWR